MEFIVPANTTIDPDSGIVTITDGGEITLPDESTMTVASGTTIDPFTGKVSQPGKNENVPSNPDNSDDPGAGGGCNGVSVGTAGLWIAALAFFSRRRAS
jgi:hypothetical protein